MWFNHTGALIKRHETQRHQNLIYVPLHWQTGTLVYSSGPMLIILDP